ncbi:MAG: alcohol dehydrogenase [Cenarchaeum symbiont of Oopsacas minuta]|nr:alcohol dehydrogenase [Cenarchaeum symbiont of Oopsacas minuta]
MNINKSYIYDAIVLKFQGKTALITGSGTGIGLAISSKFAENGASVIILGRRKEPLIDAAEKIKDIISKVQSGASVSIYDGVDVSDATRIDDMFEDIVKSGKKIDYIVNNAGVSGPVMCFPHMNMDDFKSTVAIHLTGTFWTSVRSLLALSENGKIITISTFFTEERPLEQRPYRFRSPYTAAQGAKNRLAEALSWELVDKDIISIATNPGPVHSDRIYKTVYPKAAAEFMRVSGFDKMTPEETEKASEKVLPLLGEDEKTISKGIAGDNEKTLGSLLEKISSVAEKIQKNTSRMIADGQFLSQIQVAEMVLTLCDDNIASTLNGKVIPGDRVFYPVKPHVGANTPQYSKPDLTGKCIFMTINASNHNDIDRVISVASHVKVCGGNAVCIISKDMDESLASTISEKFHTHKADISDQGQISTWIRTATEKVGSIVAIMHFTGDVPDSQFIDLKRSEWDNLVDRFVNTPASVLQCALESFVPGGSKDPRMYAGKTGLVVLVGPQLPAGKVRGEQRARVEVFRGALRPFTTTVNQELSDVLKSQIRTHLILPGSVSGAESDNEKINGALDYFLSGNATSSAQVIHCIDESR